MTGTALGDAVFGLVPPAPQGVDVVLDAAGKGSLTVPVHRVFPPRDIAAAHEESATAHARGKIVVTVP